MLTTETVGSRILVRDSSAASEFPVAVRAGDHVFAPGILAPDETPSGLHIWSHRSKCDAAYAYARRVLEACGCDPSGILHLTQYMSERGVVPASFPGRSALFGDALPGTTAIGVSDVGSPHAGIQLDIVAYAGPAASLRRKRAPDMVWFSESVRLDDTVYFAGVTTDDRAAKVDTERWQWSPVREQTNWLLDSRLALRFEAEGCGLEDVALLHCHVRQPAAQVAPVCDLLRERFGGRMPVLFMSPATYLHWDQGRIELTPVAVRPEGNRDAQTEVVTSSIEGPFGAPAAARIGDVVHVGTLVASPGAIQAGERRLHFQSRAGVEAQDILAQLESIAREFGGSLADLVRIRCTLSNMADAPAVVDVLRRVAGTSAAISIVGSQEAAGWLPGSGLSIDAALHRSQV